MFDPMKLVWPHPQQEAHKATNPARCSLHLCGSRPLFLSLSLHVSLSTGTTPLIRCAHALSSLGQNSKHKKRTLDGMPGAAAQVSSSLRLPSQAMPHLLPSFRYPFSSWLSPSLSWLPGYLWLSY